SGNDVAGADAAAGQHRGQPAAAAVEPGIADATGHRALVGGDDFAIGMPFRAVFEDPVERQRVVLHLAVDYRHASASGGSGGEMMPTFQCHGWSPCARRRQTTFSSSSNMPGMRWVPGRGVPAKPM